MPTRTRAVPTLAELHARRKVAVRLHLQEVPMMRIVAATGLSWPGVSAALKLFAEGGMAALKPAVRGRKPGSGRKLSEAQEARIRQLMYRQRPEQLGLEGLKNALWDRQSVAQLIRHECGRQPMLRAIGKYLARWQLLPPPAPKTNEPQHEPRRHWQASCYPSIRFQAADEGAEIHWGRRSVHRATSQDGAAERQRVTMLSTTTNRGKARWMLFAGPVNAERLIEFMTSLLNDTQRDSQRDTQRKIVLIIDRFRAFRHPAVLAWRLENAGRLELVFLPGARSGAGSTAGPEKRRRAPGRCVLPSAASVATRRPDVRHRHHREGPRL